MISTILGVFFSPFFEEIFFLSAICASENCELHAPEPAIVAYDVDLLPAVRQLDRLADYFADGLDTRNGLLGRRLYQSPASYTESNATP